MKCRVPSSQTKLYGLAASTRRNPWLPAMGAVAVISPEAMRPGSAGRAMIEYVQAPAWLGVNRTLNICPPSQKPLTVLMASPGPLNVAVTVTSV